MRRAWRARLLAFTGLVIAASLGLAQRESGMRGVLVVAGGRAGSGMPHDMDEEAH